MADDDTTTTAAGDQGDQAPAGDQNATPWTEPADPAPSTFEVIQALAAHIDWHGDTAARDNVDEWLATHPDNPDREDDGDELEDDEDDEPAPPAPAPKTTARKSAAGRRAAPRRR